ncbi:MAG: PLDc N-terminal domain-containing protein [Chitinophagaceae bacterium]|nr:PLDc N-terminal domain-containing protein [Chitinophagaceae bacterium]
MNYSSLGISMPGSGSDVLLIAIGALIFIYWVKTLVHILRTHFSDVSVKIYWLIIVLVFNVAGVLVYDLFGRSKHRQA